LLIKWKDHHIC